LSRIADVLGLPKESLFVLAHPEASSPLGTPRNAALRQEQDQARQQFAGNKALLARHQVKSRELKVLSQVNLLGKITATSVCFYTQRNSTSRRRGKTSVRVNFA
jgi:hypothetical protein